MTNEELTHNACPICKIHCHCHWCFTSVMDRLKQAEGAKTDLDALLALYRDQQAELEESRCVARELWDELEGGPSWHGLCASGWDKEWLEKYPWLTEEE